jgi:outer membrane murein-binding lipoprotein Lpp
VISINGNVARFSNPERAPIRSLWENNKAQLQEDMNMKKQGMALVVSALLVTAGCASIEKSDAMATERELAAAGFQMKFAKTTEQIAKVESLPQRKLTRTSGPDGKTRFVWADATDCKCIYVGSEAAYDRFQRLSISQQIAEENEMAASMNWGAWGAWGPMW